MDLKVHENLEPIKDSDEILEPEELLDDCWFFRNLLHCNNSRMFRWFSDPCTSANNYSKEIFGEKSYEETYESTEEFQDEETEFSMGKLIRQASMKSLDTGIYVKGVSPNSSITRHQPRKKPEIENIKMEGLGEIRTQPIMNQLRKQKNSSVLEYKDLQDFGFDVKKEDTLNPHKISTIPGFQEKHPLYLSEPRRTQSSAPPVLKWGGKKSTEAMKEQIKFWARAVVSNVHQEC